MKNVGQSLTIVAMASISMFGALSAQPPVRADSSRRMDDVCYRFSFGSWEPALDMRAAGHEPLSRPIPSAAPGRDWAADIDGKSAATLMLFPQWWPAGVVIELPHGAPAMGDTVTGTASALVADARVKAPMATARAWGMPCARPARNIR